MSYVRRKRPIKEKQRFWLVRQLVNKYGGDCYLCHENFQSKKDITLDHLIAKSKGGDDNIENLRLAHQHCNAAKKNMSLEEYAIMQEGY